MWCDVLKHRSLCVKFCSHWSINKDCVKQIVRFVSKHITHVTKSLLKTMWKDCIHLMLNCGVRPLFYCSQFLRSGFYGWGLKGTWWCNTLPLSIAPPLTTRAQLHHCLWHSIASLTVISLTVINLIFVIIWQLRGPPVRKWAWFSAFSRHPHYLRAENNAYFFTISVYILGDFFNNSNLAGWLITHFSIVWQTLNTYLLLVYMDFKLTSIESGAVLRTSPCTLRTGGGSIILRSEKKQHDGDGQP